MKHCYALLCILWVGTNSTSAQWIYSQGFAAISGAPELQRINLEDHTFVRLTGMGDMGDIAFHPNQDLYGVIFDKVYLIDTVTSAYTEVYDIGDFQSVGMTIDYKGNMYFSGYNPNTNRYGVAIYNPLVSTTRIVADFGPINQGFINDIEFYNGQLFVVGELPSNFSERAVLFRVDTTGLNQHDTIVQYNMWPGRALAAISDTCGSHYLVSPATSLLNYFYPPLDSVRVVNLYPADGLFYSSGATSRTSHVGSIPGLKISGIDISQDPCVGNSNAIASIQIQPGRPGSVKYSLDGINYQDSNSFTNVPPGNYQVFITDNWGCQEKEYFEIVEIPTFPLTFDVTPATCGVNNGKIVIHTEVDGLNYALDSSGFSEDSLFTNLEGGDHILIIRNDAGCRDTIEIQIDSYQAPTFETLVESEQCNVNNGVIELINVDGEGPFQFSLNGMAWQDNHIFDQLTTGPYAISITDVFNCIVQKEIFLTETGLPEIVDIQVLPEECGERNGQIELIVVSNHGPLQYSLNGIGSNNVPAFYNLSTGSYTILVVDTFGCITEALVGVPGKGGPVINDIQVTPEYCGNSNGSIKINATSEHGPLQLSINNGPYTYSSEFKELMQGQYHVVVRDTNGCLQQTEIVIDYIDGIKIDTIISEDAKCSLENGSILILADKSSINEYSLNRQIFQPEPFFNNLTSGDYTAYLLSFGVCIDSVVVTLEGNSNPVIDDFILVQPTCKKDQAMVTVLAHGAGELIFELDHDILNTHGHFSDLTDGFHEILITDKSGCRSDTAFSIVQQKCAFYIPNVFSPNGDGVNDIFGFIVEEENVHVDQFEIYDRWGNKVYDCIISDGCEWDGSINGKSASPGVYFYHILYADTNEIKRLTGQVTLVR